mgnify:CR=1 FL=1
MFPAIATPELFADNLGNSEYIKMRFSASITTEENILSKLFKRKERDDSTFKGTETTTGYEMESVEHTIHIQPDVVPNLLLNKQNLTFQVKYFIFYMFLDKKQSNVLFIKC